MNMNAHVPDRSYGFGSGLLAGTVIGAGLLMWLAPRIGAELRQRATETAGRLRQQARERYRDVSSQVGDAVDDVTRKAQGVRDDVAEVVAHAAEKTQEASNRFPKPQERT